MRDQMIGEDWYADIWGRVHFDYTIIEQCHLATLRAWDKDEEPGKKLILYTKIIQGSGEAFTDFCKDWLQQWTKHIGPSYETSVNWDLGKNVKYQI